MRKRHYTARWAQAGHPSIANVSFEASHDTNAKRVADKLAREMNVTRTPRTITRDGVLIETLSDRGVS